MTDHITAADESQIPLSEMIETLRVELQKSLEKTAGQAVVFAVDKVELELKVLVSRRAKGEGGIAFWVVKAGAAAEGGRDTSHTFKLTLSPLDAATRERLQVTTTTVRPPSGR